MSYGGAHVGFKDILYQNTCLLFCFELLYPQGRHIMTYDRLSSSHVHAHEAADLIIQAELSVYTPLSSGVSHSTPSQAVGLSTIDMSYCACEIAFA